MASPFAAETELLILRLLKNEPTGMYGLEFVKASDNTLKRGTVYVTLGRMEEEGLYSLPSEARVRPSRPSTPALYHYRPRRACAPGRRVPRRGDREGLSRDHPRRATA